MNPELYDTNVAQAALHAAALDSAVSEMQQKIAILERGTRTSRASANSARLRRQIDNLDGQLAEIHRMRSELKRRFGV